MAKTLQEILNPQNLVNRYYMDHSRCPACHGSNLEVTTRGFLPSRTGEMRDANRAECACGWQGIVHDLIPKEKTMAEIGKLTPITYIIEPGLPPVAIVSPRGGSVTVGTPYDKGEYSIEGELQPLLDREKLAAAVAPYAFPGGDFLPAGDGDLAKAGKRPTVEQMVREILSQAVEDELVRVRRGDPHPQDRTAGDLTRVANTLAGYLRERPRNAIVELSPEQSARERHAEVVGLLREMKKGLVDATKDLRQMLASGQDSLTITGDYTGRIGFPEELLDRLLRLLSLSEGERAFVQAAADARHDPAKQVDALLIFADWLEDQGREAHGARVRRLVPENGEVLIGSYPTREPHAMPADAVTNHARQRGCEAMLADIQKHCAKTGREVYAVSMPEGWDIDTASARGLMRTQTFEDAFKPLIAAMKGETEEQIAGGAGQRIAQMIYRLKEENARLKKTRESSFQSVILGERNALEKEVLLLKEQAKYSASKIAQLEQAILDEREACATLAENYGTMPADQVALKILAREGVSP